MNANFFRQNNIHEHFYTDQAAFITCYFKMLQAILTV